jgi:tungstate transport system substrate-binding protein
MKSKVLFSILCLIVLAGKFAVTGCTTPATTTPNQPSVSTPTTPAVQSFPVVPGKTRFKIATTTSLYDTGLWYYLEPIFEKKYNVEMDIIYAGTGIALEYGRKGDVDAVIVHDPAAEDKFIGEGYGINRRKFGYNFFLIAGPASDPAGIKGLDAAGSFKKIAEAGMKDPDKVKFVSRGDNSGTHSKEKLIWQAAGYKYEDIQKSGKWYVEAGKGMGPCLLMANEMQSYILADISTFLSMKGKITLESLVEADPLFLNVYSAIAINPEKIKTAKIDMANNFINWLISPEVQTILSTYGKAEYGRSLFFAASDGKCTQKGCPTVEEYTKPVP